jgi:DNA polymerase III alpha subunit (gram-positive type)
MKVEELLNNSITDFMSTSIDINDYVGLSIMTDGLKASRDTVIGFCLVDSSGEELGTILFNEGDPDKTAAYHGIPVDQFKVEGVSPAEGVSKFLELLGSRYIVLHNHVFGCSFLSEFLARHNLVPITTPVVSLSLLHQAINTPDTLMPALSEELSLAYLSDTLKAISFPKNTKKTLPALFELCPLTDSTDYINRLPAGRGNAYMIVEAYKKELNTTLLI